MGHVDDEGWIFLADRATNMIITGGVNVYPAEVEQALLEHPAVLDVAVFGIPDEEWGEQVKAAVEFAAGETVADTELIDFARERLGRHKVPRRSTFTSHSPANRTASCTSRRCVTRTGKATTARSEAAQHWPELRW